MSLPRWRTRATEYIYTHCQSTVHHTEQSNWRSYRFYTMIVGKGCKNALFSSNLLLKGIFFTPLLAECWATNLQTFVCSLCYREYQTETGLKQHFSLVHSGKWLDKVKEVGFAKFSSCIMHILIIQGVLCLGCVLRLWKNNRVSRKPCKYYMDK